MSETILANMRTLLAKSVPLSEIVVNDGDERWGETCTMSSHDAAILVEAWIGDGCKPDDSPAVWADQIERAADWLRRTGNTL